MKPGASRLERRTAVLRVAACLLLVAITGDLLVDTGCDAVSASPASAAALRAPADGRRESSEPCAPLCVPDCSCCSRSVAASAAVVPPEPVLLAFLRVPAAEHRREGVRPVVDHPPLHRS
jgi:hypothetical protein